MELNEFQLDQFLEQLHNCHTPHEVLQTLHQVATSIGLTAIRYYRFRRAVQPENDTFYSVASVGCDKSVTEKLSAGRITKTRSMHPHDKSETFWSVDTAHPIALKLVNSSECIYPLKLLTEFGGLPELHVPPDPDEPELTEAKRQGSGKWIDIPLIIGRWTIGKLSCDCMSDMDFRAASTARDIYAFKRFATSAAPVLEMVRNQNFSAPLQYASVTIRDISNIPHLLDFCTETLRSPSFFNCEQADVLLSSRDSRDKDTLVLFKTTFPPMQGQEMFAHYRLGKPNSSLTAWVADTRRSVRVDGMLDPQRRARQLLIYGNDLNWEQKIPLSNKHGSLLIVHVPLLDNSSHEFAIIRLADKRGQDNSVIAFDERDESLLEKIAHQTIGPKIYALKHQEVLDAVQTKLVSVREMVIPHESPWNRLIEIVSSAIEEDPLAKGWKKRYFVSRMADDDHFEILAEGGKLERVESQTRFECSKTLTGRAIISGHVVFESDLRSAQEKAQYRPVVKDAVCAMACPMTYRKKIIGAIAIASSHRDLSLEKHRYILETIADEAAATLEHYRVAMTTTLLAGVRHDFQAILSVLDDDIAPHEELQHLSGVIDVLGELATVHCCSKDPDPNTLLQMTVDRDITVMLREITELSKNLDPQSDLVDIELSHVGDVQSARVFSAAVTACFFNMMRNAIGAALKNGGPVRVRSKIDPACLEVIITNNASKTGAEPPINNVDNWLDVPVTDVRGMGIPITRRVQSWYRFPGTACGEYRAHVTAEGLHEVMLRFPLPLDHR